jgi:hypothetical protein
MDRRAKIKGKGGAVRIKGGIEDLESNDMMDRNDGKAR